MHTVALLKPDAFTRRHVGDILHRIENGGFDIEHAATHRLMRTQAMLFYAEHRGREYWEPLIAHMISGTTMALVLHHERAVAHWREMMGGSDPAQRAAWTIRGTWTTPDMPRWENLVHGSDSSEAFEREAYLIKTWHSCALNP